MKYFLFSQIHRVTTKTVPDDWGISGLLGCHENMRLAAPETVSQSEREKTDRKLMSLHG